MNRDNSYLIGNQFAKGNIPWNKSDNYKICPICGSNFHSPPSDNQIYCSRQCVNIFHKGKKFNNALEIWQRENGTSWNKGILMSEEAKHKVSETKLKNPIRYWLNKERPELRKKVKSKWTAFRRQLSERTEYKQWVRFIFKRDNYTCQICGKKSGNGKAVYLNAHHIFEAKLYPEYLLNTTFGITLCQNCHYDIHKSCGRGEDAVLEADLWGVQYHTIKVLETLK